MESDLFFPIIRGGGHHKMSLKKGEDHSAKVLVTEPEPHSDGYGEPPQEDKDKLRNAFDNCERPTLDCLQCRSHQMTKALPWIET